MSTAVWLSSAVVNTCDLRVGIVVFRSIKRVVMPPIVSMPKDRELHQATARRVLHRQYRTLYRCTNCNNFIRVNRFVRFFAEEIFNEILHFWHTVDPPTRITSSIGLFDKPASCIAFWHGLSKRSKISLHSDSSFARDNFIQDVLVQMHQRLYREN